MQDLETYGLIIAGILTSELDGWFGIILKAGVIVLIILKKNIF